jgi:eukaryotic-like serine/threonine-protein kinase
MIEIIERLRKLLPRRQDRIEEKRFKIVVLLVLGSVVTMILVAMVTFAVTIKGPEVVLVPDVVGGEGHRMDLVAAMVRLQEKGLYGKVQLRHSSKLAKGTVIDQRPKAGSQVKAGRRVSLTVSKGSVVEQVGNYVKKDLGAVRIELQSLFPGDEEVLIRIREPVMFAYNEAEPGTVVRQSPAPGTPVREGEVTYLDLVVSRGPQGKMTATANYLGKPFAQIMADLGQKGVPFTFVARAAQGNEAGGVVVKQMPAPNEEAPENTVVLLTVSEPKRLEKGKEFGVYSADLVRYPILVKMELIERGKEGDRVIVSMRHPGGTVGIPYIKDAESQLVFYVNGLEWKR